MTLSRQIHLTSRPSGLPTAEHFELASVELPPPAAGEVQVRNDWMTVDPYMRCVMEPAKSYIEPYAIGAPPGGGAIGTVLSSTVAGFRPGDIVMSDLGWREAFNAPAEAVRKLDSHGLPVEAFLGIAGVPRMTAWAGMVKVGEVDADDIVFVSGAAGAVGSVACQIAKIRGARVIGSAGGPEKMAFLREIGCDETIDYKAEPDLIAALNRVAPDGITMLFDNVGGSTLDAALMVAQPHAHFLLCGIISQYNDGEPYGVRHLMEAIARRIRIDGFGVYDYVDQTDAFVADMKSWLDSGLMINRETIDEGIESAPGAFLKLFTGKSIGKMLVKLS
jgi:NADPH-dependent curcumin reductase CurA